MTAKSRHWIFMSFQLDCWRMKNRTVRRLPTPENESCAWEEGREGKGTYSESTQIYWSSSSCEVIPIHHKWWINIQYNSSGLQAARRELWRRQEEDRTGQASTSTLLFHYFIPLNHSHILHQEYVWGDHHHHHHLINIPVAGTTDSLTPTHPHSVTRRLIQTRR